MPVGAWVDGGADRRGVLAAPRFSARGTVQRSRLRVTTTVSNRAGILHVCAGY
jgi:hypothetical protein